MPAISFSGIASGIDGDAIIKAIIDGKKLAIQPMQAKVDNNTTENTALEELNTKLLTLNDNVSDFLTLAGGSVSKLAQSSNEDAVSASAGSAAAASTTTLNVQQLAKAASLSFAGTYSDLNGPIAPGLSGPTSIQITLGTGSGAQNITVPVDENTTVSSFVNSVNNGDSSGRLRATLINVGTTDAPSYKIVLSSTRTGVQDGSLDVQPSPELNAAGALQVGTLQQAQDAILQMDSLGTITRSSNQISDLIPGVTLNLKQENTGPVVVSINNDADKTAQRLNNMVTAINAVIKYSHDNSAITRVDTDQGPVNKYGTLARTSVDDRVVEAIKRAISDAQSGIGSSNVRIFADLGVTTEKDGTLKFDSDKFMQAVAADPVAANNILQHFADNVGATGGIISEYTRFQGVIEEAKTSNQDQIDDISTRINQIQDNLDKQTQALKLKFATLEQNMAKLNSNADSIAGLIGSAPARR